MCDDMGFSDLGCYGSEISTPNIDRLAEEGVRFTQFKNTGRSCPSRASLLTGCYQHHAGMGWMTAVDEHRAGYRGQISDEIPTIAEVLKGGGYSTYMTGKWHVTINSAFSNMAKSEIKSNGSFPTDRGFDHYYGALTGGGDYYNPTGLLDDDKAVLTLPDDYYYTHAITQNSVRFIDEHDTSQPLFMYIAHYAPHRPLQAPKERIEACKAQYEVGYDVLREARYERQQQMGIIPDGYDLPIHNAEFQGQKRLRWEELTPEEQRRWVSEMATYAAMIEIVDEGVGEVIEATKRAGIYDNTIFIFLSDNGGTSEGGKIAQYIADLSNTPYRDYKKSCYMGGNSSPLIIYNAKLFGEYAGELRSDVVHIMDILPTCAAMADVKYPKKFNGVKAECDGVSMLPAIEGKSLKSRDMFFEHQTSSAIISGEWKLVRAKSGDEWQLVNLADDPFEMRDLAADNPKKRDELEAKWMAWAEANDVLPLETRPWSERIKYYNNLK